MTKTALLLILILRVVATNCFVLVSPIGRCSHVNSELFLAGPRSGRRRTRPARPKREGHNESSSVVFDGKAMTAAQLANQNAPPINLREASDLRFMSGDLEMGPETARSVWIYRSLDDIYEGLSEAFNRDHTWREAMREAIRRDVFDSTPAYANLSDKAANVMLLPDSSLQGSWRKQPNHSGIRMKRLTRVLREQFGEDCSLSGDDLMHAIGAWCGPKPSTHWIDIVGVQDRKVSHSWHLDTGLSPENSKTVLWGFPPENNYQGCGVFSHIVALQHECHAPSNHPRMEPLLFAGKIDETHIFRPSYAPGKELIMYRDIDVLHSSPDVAYRTSVMRFM